MDASGIQIVISFTSVASFIGAVGAVIKAFRSQAVAKEARDETDVIQRERKTQAEFRDSQLQKLETELEVVKSQLASHNQRLDEGNAKFNSLQGELKETNGLLREVIGAMKVKMNLLINTSTGL